MVQMMLPMKKQAIVLITESTGIADNACRGRAGWTKKLGKGPVNWNKERKKRYSVMGVQKMGTTNHVVRVRIYKTRFGR